MNESSALQSLGQIAKRVLPKPSPVMVVDTFNLVLASAHEWVRVVLEEKTKRDEIRAWEQPQLEIIHVQRDVLLTALDMTFDERAETFRRLFDNLDAAPASDREGAGAHFSEILTAITDLAQTGPFKDLKSPALVVQVSCMRKGHRTLTLARASAPTAPVTGRAPRINALAVWVVDRRNQGDVATSCSPSRRHPLPDLDCRPA